MILIREIKKEFVLGRALDQVSGNVSSVDTHATFLIEGPQHDSDSHCRVAANGVLVAALRDDLGRRADCDGIIGNVSLDHAACPDDRTGTDSGRGQYD